MMSRIYLTALSFCLSSILAHAQYFQFSQYNFTTQRVNPAMVAASDYASIGLIYRNQSASDVRLSTTMASVQYPLISSKTGMRWSGLGLSLMDDRSGGIFSLQEASASYALNLNVGRWQTVSLGFKGLYQQRKLNLEGLFTGSQYVEDRGFDPSLYNGEDIRVLQSDFFTFSSGLFWQQVDKAGRRLHYAGFSFFDLNRPNESFSNVTSQLNSTFLMNIGSTVYQDRTWSVSPEILVANYSRKTAVTAGMVTGYTLQNSRTAFPRIDIITKYAVGRSAILGLQYHKEELSMGVSFDLPLIKQNAANFNTVEVAIELRRMVNPRMKQIAKQKSKMNTAAKKPAPQPKNPQPKKIQPKDSVVVSSRTAVPEAQKENLKTSLQHKQDSVLARAHAGNLRHQPLLLETITLHFNFEFNSSDLDQESKKYLNDLITALQENPHLSIKLTGHTDNVGSIKFNEKLSLFRANSIRDYLLEQGIEAERIQTFGKGMHEPLNSNKTEEERAKNRRVELEILYAD